MHRLTIVLALLVACGTAKPGGMSGPSMNNKISSEPAVGARSPVVSWDILDREPLANTAQVKHILIGWKDLADSYGGRIDARAAKRTKADAEAEIRKLLGELHGGADFDTIMKAHSEDEGSAATGRPYTVTPDAQLVIEFRQLGLRLKVDELGVVQSDYGFHIIKRLQ
jgi:peptidyl-prolyl cis-trans isomerase D